MNLCLPGPALAEQLYVGVRSQGLGPKGTQSLAVVLAPAGPGRLAGTRCSPRPAGPSRPPRARRQQTRPPDRYGGRYRVAPCKQLSKTAARHCEPAPHHDPEVDSSIAACVPASAAAAARTQRHRVDRRERHLTQLRRARLVPVKGAGLTGRRRPPAASTPARLERCTQRLGRLKQDGRHPRARCGRDVARAVVDHERRGRLKPVALQEHLDRSAGSGLITPRPRTRRSLEPAQELIALAPERIGVRLHVGQREQPYRALIGQLDAGSPRSRRSARPPSPRCACPTPRCARRARDARPPALRR